jgi:glutamine amidotransferase
MCRMFGMVAECPITPRDLLHDAPRSLRALSREHPDGWGIAVHDGSWTVERGTSCAHACERFAAVGDRAARIVIAHVRKKTVGPTALVNTHPFRRGDFVFAHNGTLKDAGALPSLPSTSRRSKATPTASGCSRSYSRTSTRPATSCAA